MLKKGFTLIELLIVIAVLGILAVAVLAAINPIEQINRSRDTGSRSDAEQLISGIDRYYATTGYYPWMAGASSNNTTLTWGEINDSAQTFGTDAEPMLTNLSATTAELKEAFVNRITDPGYNFLWIVNDGNPGDSTYVCFEPASKSFKDEAKGRCDGTKGSIPGDLTAPVCDDVGEVWYSCLP